jgi:nicastrin
LYIFLGESFDYIGSSRMIYDMKENKFPQEVETSDESKITWPLINLDSLEAQIELGQLMNNGNEGTMFTHMDTQFPAAGQDLLRDLRNEAQKLGLTLDSPTLDKGLPPSSIQSLLKEDRSVPGIFLANFDQKYINKYYHSLYDNSSKSGYDHAIPDNKLVQHLSKIAETVARLVWSRVGQGQAPGQDFKANKTLINDLIYCYTISANCSMFAAVTSSDFVSKKSLPTKPLPQYVGVDRSLTYHTIFTYRVLSYLTSKSLDGPFTPENCTTPQNQSMYSYLFIKGNSPPNWWTGTPQECQDSLECGFCLNTTSWMAEAVSPAFVIDDYDFHDPQYASWAESSWQFTSSRMFLKASPYQERGYFALGIIMLVLSFCIVIWLDKYASLIFVPETSTPEDQEPIQPPTAL